jgi:hypothetical protein
MSRRRVGRDTILYEPAVRGEFETKASIIRKRLETQEIGMARKDSVCTVIQAGVSVGVPGITDPAIRLLLNDVNGTFTTTFFAAENGKNQMLDIALAAISSEKRVNAFLDDPSEPVSPPGAQVYSLDILAE